MKLEKARVYYEKVLSLIESNRDISRIDNETIKSIRDKHLLHLELIEVYGINVAFENINNTDYLRINEFTVLSTFDGNSNRRISWSDDGSQPTNERLLNVSFPTGAYIFGDHYPTDLFNEFFLELKAFGCAYSDTKNSCLYYDLHTGSKVIIQLYGILKKYQDKNKDQVKYSEIKKLEQRLKALKE